MSDESRAKIAAAQQKRWAKVSGKRTRQLRQLEPLWSYRSSVTALTHTIRPEAINLGVFLFSVVASLVGRILPQWSIPLRPLEATELQTR